MNEIVDKRFELEFKKLFKKLLNESVHLSFVEILDRVTSYLEIHCSDDLRKSLDTWYHCISRQTFLENILLHHQVEEIVFYNKDYISFGEESPIRIELDEEDYILSWTLLAFQNGVSWNHAHPFASFKATIADKNLRITLTHPSCSPDNTMRAFVRTKMRSSFKLSDFTDQDQALYLEQAVLNKKNIVCMGATKSGKTTLMETLLKRVDASEHVIILEDVHELSRDSSKTTNLLAHPTDPKRSLSEYCAMALRMSPERIVLGEIRSKEVIPLLLAFNSGHRGGMTSLHADSVPDGLERMALLFQLYSENAQLPHQKVMELVCKNIDVAVFVSEKNIKTIVEIKGCESGRAIFEEVCFNEQANCLISGQNHADDWWKKASAH